MAYTERQAEMTAKKICPHEKRMVPIVDGLLLSECCSYGWKSNLKGAVEEARRIAARSGGIARIRSIIEEREEKAKNARKDEKAERDKAEKARYVER
jgi:hypothetical protein